MNTNSIIKLILGVLLLALIFPALGWGGFIAIPEVVKWILVILLALIGLKLIMDAVNRI
jgi:uncharacterized membrane protein YdcZ (DUF606 family)